MGAPICAYADDSLLYSATASESTLFGDIFGSEIACAIGDAFMSGQYSVLVAGIENTASQQDNETFEENFKKFSVAYGLGAPKQNSAR